MSELFGLTRDVVKTRYALRTPSGFVTSTLPDWAGAVCIVQISPEMGSRFCQVLIKLEPASEGKGNTGRNEHFLFVLAGGCSASLGGMTRTLTGGSYAYLPPDTDFRFYAAAPGTQLLVFQKAYQRVKGIKEPGPINGHEGTVAGKPFLGNHDARLQVLLPEALEFDMAVNIFTYQPGATLPFVETHIMEHGLLMLKGQGVYRLDTDYHPVQAGDVIWMAAYCPQWFVAMGKTPAAYIYYKDVNRDPMS
ncbi:MAG TPA: (S)-ureidoglycine aminohydrolase [Candidatus Acidoferrum sp.]|nr:(S)-ureidoglycine aminohydrolase [Candidatus Acidoferrum sp.]